MIPDLALDPSPAAQVADYKIDLDRRWTGDFAVYQKRRILWLVPYWHRVKGYFHSVDDAQTWLKANWRIPAYYKFTKVPK